MDVNWQHALSALYTSRHVYTYLLKYFSHTGSSIMILSSQREKERERATICFKVVLYSAENGRELGDFHRWDYILLVWTDLCTDLPDIQYKVHETQVGEIYMHHIHFILKQYPDFFDIKLGLVEVADPVALIYFKHDCALHPIKYLYQTWVQL